MSWFRSVKARAFAVCVGLAAYSSTAHAQVCFGAPAKGAAAYEYVRYSVGTGHGGSISTTAGRLALGANFNTRSMRNPLSSASGFEGAGRAALVIALGKVKLCPGIAVGYAKLSKELIDDLKLSDQQLFARGGVGVGLEQHVYGGVSIIPSLGVHYDFTATKFDVDATGGKNETTGDTLSRVAIDYSLGLRYRFVYLAASALRYSDTGGGRPVRGRFIVGFAFGGAPAASTSKSRD